MATAAGHPQAQGPVSPLDAHQVGRLPADLADHDPGRVLQQRLQDWDLDHGSAEFARHLVSKGHAVTVVAADLSYLSGKKTQKAGKAITEQDVDGIRVFRAYTYPSFHKSWTGRIISFLSFMTTSFPLRFYLKFTI